MVPDLTINSGDIISQKQKQTRKKLQSGFDSDCSLIVIDVATLSTPPFTGLSGIQFTKTPKYIR